MNGEMPKMRRAFEEWLEAEMMPAESDWFRRDPDDPEEYDWASTHYAYKAWQEAARQAMERAIEACDNVEEKPWYGYENPNTFQDGKWKCMDAIRALADVAGEKGVGNGA